MTVVVVEEAGRHFYESREEGVGDYFVESLLSDLGSLVLYAGIHRRHFGLHRMLSRRFPFAVYYDVEASAALVYAVLDMRRVPLWIRTELGKRM